MTNKKESPKEALFRKVITENSRTGELKSQVSVVLSQYDTSTMPDFVEGSKVYKGFLATIITLKPSKQNPRNRVDLDPSNEELRQAIEDLYTTYDSLK